MKILGLRELQRDLKNLAGRDSKKIVRGSLKEAAIIIKDEAARRAPKQQIPGGGTLAKSLKVSLGRRDPKDQIRAYVLVKAPKVNKGRSKAKKTKDGAIAIQKNPRKYAHLVEYGTQPHALGKGAKLRQVREDGTIRRGTHQEGTGHPGSQPKPFIRPAVEAVGEKAIDTFADTYTSGIGKAMGVDLGGRFPKRVQEGGDA